MVKINPVTAKVRTQLEDELPIGDFKPRTEMMQRAFDWGRELHKGQIRLSGEPYFECHCGWVASLVDHLIGNEAWTIAALLHDAIEDQDVTLEDIHRKFPGPLGEEVGTIVDGTTKLITSRGGRSKEIETLRKIATFRNPAVFLIKLADRTHNMLTLNFMPRSKQIPKAEEAIRAYGRLAGILNCYRWRCWLEDMAFPYYQPETYEYVRSKIDADPRLSPGFINPLMEKLAGVMEKEGLSGEVSVVVNGYWRSWLKLKEMARNRLTSLDTFANVDDLVSFRLVADSSDDRECYRLLAGVNRFLGSYLDQTGFNDYIAIPQNGYQALQVTGWFENFGAIEVAIASREMEGENMWGVVYNLQHNRPISQYQPVTILTPTGGLRFVEEGATVLDAVASIQQDFFLDKVTNVEVNGNLAHLSDRVHPGDVIEVITGDQRMVPSENWLSFASRSTIPLLRSVLVNQELKREADAGRKIIRSIIIEHGITDLEDVQALEPEKMDRLLGLLASPNLEDLYAAVGGGAIGLTELTEKLEKVAITRKELGWSTIFLEGPPHANQPGVMAHLAGLIWQANANILRVVNNTYPNRGYEIRIVTVKLSSEQKEIVWDALHQLKDELGLHVVDVI
ncbi:MAG: HD domain-containing protein [Anaerolineae bacterium]|nr:HD domain-containing protein [Anaerolineae bacterium]